MGQFSVKIYTSPGSLLSANQHYRQLRRNGVGAAASLDQILSAASVGAVNAYRADDVCAALCRRLGNQAPTGLRKRIMVDPIDAVIASLGDWRADLLARIRKLINNVDPAITEDVKWRKPSNLLGVPTWSHTGILCTGETYKDKIKLTFFKGAALADPEGLFHAGQGGGTRRAVDIREGDSLNEAALENLIREAIAANFATKER
jgi:hypothetical protein